MAEKANSAMSESALNYAYHLDATAYAKYLRSFAETQGVKRVEGRIDAVPQNAEGAIASVQLSHGAQPKDLFVDRSGLLGY